MAKFRSREDLRQMRKKRIRRVLIGTAERPRIVVYRSSKHIYAQLVDDGRGHTLADACTLSKEVKEKGAVGRSADTAKIVGQVLAEKAKALKIEQVVFDRGGYRYHGVVKALAEGAREAGLRF